MATWSRPLYALLCVLLFSGLVPEARAQDESTWLVDVTVEASICDAYAVVDVTAHIRNRGPDPEFPFLVQVPNGALVTGLTIVRDGEVHHATIQERAAARAAYEGHKAAEKTGGLVEKRGSQAFHYLINVAAFEEVHATLRYEGHLQAARGIIDLPLEAPVSGFGQDMGARFEATLCAGEATTVWSAPSTSAWQADGWHLSHSVGPRPNDDATLWSVHYTRAATPAEGAIAAVIKDGQGVFAHRFQAEPDPDRIPADLVLVLDTSGSMNGDKILQLQDAARQVIGALNASDRLHLAFFSSTVHAPWSGMRAMDEVGRASAITAIDAATAGGGTNIEDGLLQAYEALGPLDAERTPLVVLLSDGQAQVGQDVRDRVAERASEGARLFTLAFGARADWSLLHGLAVAGQGVAERIESGVGAEADIQRFMAAWTTPVLRNVEITYDDGIQATQEVDILFGGSELLIAGTFDPALHHISGTVRADTAQGAYEQAFTAPVADGGHPWLERLVVFREIQALQDRLAAGNESARAPLLAAALEHGFVTDVTSLVLLLPHSGPSETADDPVRSALATSTSARTMTSTQTGIVHDQAADSEGSSQSTPGLGIVGMAAALAIALRRR